ncbi:MAG: helix-turn-helix transcriptional regulator [Bacteroidales bacterium]|nr:helix-turn-helix transcriptional regulator [Bacteroidales bacterium]
MTSFGEQIRTLREEKELPLRKVAAFLDIDPSLLGKIERNKRQPSKELIKQIAFFFKIDEKNLIRQFISDQIAYKIIEEGDMEILKVAEKKVMYLKDKK